MSRVVRGTRTLAAAMLALLGALQAPVSAEDSSFTVSSTVLQFHPPSSCTGLTVNTPIEDFTGGCAAPGVSDVSITGTSGRVLHGYLEAWYYTCANISHPFFPRLYSSFSVRDFVITATGQTGPVLVQFGVEIQGDHSLGVSCSNCAPINWWDPDAPELTHMSVSAGFGPDTIVVGPPPPGGSTSAVWNGMIPIGDTGYHWNTELFIQVDLSRGRQCQTSGGWAEALVRFGPVNPDGSIGPVFTFPDCPTCTANAPSIGLVDNYFLAPPSLCEGDVNDDNAINVADFNILAGNFGTSVPPNSGGDLNGDGIVNVADFNLLAVNFGCEGAHPKSTPIWAQSRSS